MITIEKLSLEDTEKLMKDGNLKLISSELIPSENQSLIEDYLQERAEQLMTDVVGMPKDSNQKYNFYRINFVQEIKMFSLKRYSNKIAA